MRAMLTLPEDQRAAIVLVAIDGLSYKDAAEILVKDPELIASVNGLGALHDALATIDRRDPVRPCRPQLVGSSGV